MSQTSYSGGEAAEMDARGGRLQRTIQCSERKYRMQMKSLTAGCHRAVKRMKARPTGLAVEQTRS